MPYLGNKGLVVRWEIGYAELRFAPVPRSARNDGGRERRRNERRKRPARLAPRPHPRPLSKGEGSRDTMFGASHPSPLERGRG
ncbi:MAG: hypothetical protein LBB79_04130 [Prevotellaceae bacterium]|nr:hypothetical protein [Prevotellaceae bacterium]